MALLGTWTWGRLNPGPGGAPELEAGDAGRTRSCGAPRSPSPTPRASGRRLAADGSGERYAPAKRRVLHPRHRDALCQGAPWSRGRSIARIPGPPPSTSPFSMALSRRLQRQEDLGVALVAARVSAEHFQRELGMLDAAALRLIGAGRGRRALMGEALALQADCLTGVWAAAAGNRLGPVPARLLEPTGLVVAQRRRRSWRAKALRVPAEFDAFGRATQEAREAAFLPGYAGGGVGRLPGAGGGRRGAVALRGGRARAARARRGAGCRRAAPAAPS